MSTSSAAIVGGTQAAGGHAQDGNTEDQEFVSVMSELSSLLEKKYQNKEVPSMEEQLADLRVN